MHRGSRLLLRRRNAIKAQLLLLVIVFSEVRFFASSLYVAERGPDYSKGCDQVTCRIGEECVNRKFWCKHSPCPSMTYCSKSRKDSLKGPDTCESVICTSGYKCVVRTRGCEWNQSFTHTECKERTARCVSEWEFQNDPVSCVDINCPAGHRCILRESNCYQVPCKLTKSCAEARDVQMWFEKCRQLGCSSEQQCFLRKPSQFCNIPPCNHVPDCLNINYAEGLQYSSNEYCHGWICPPNQECSASLEVPCRQENCRVTRTCKGSSLHDFNTSRNIQQRLDIIPTQTTLADLEREAILQENRKLQNFLKPTSISNITKWMRSNQNFDEITPTHVSLTYKNEDYATPNEKQVTSNPNIRSTSFGELPWLTYFKKKAGAHVVQYWIEKSKNNDDYEGFEDWLESVASILDPETYRLWLEELEAVSTKIPEFQSWMLLHNIGPRPSSIYNKELTSETDVDVPLYNKANEDARKNHLTSYGRTKNNFYRNPFEQKQGASGMSGGPMRGSEFENVNEERRSNPSKFNFNEVRRFDELPIRSPAPPTLNSMQHRPLYEATNRQPGLSPTLASFNQKLPELPMQNSNTHAKKSWKPKLSYYSFDSTNSNNPLLSPIMQNPYHLNNYTRGHSMGSFPNIHSQRQQQNKFHYPYNINNFEKPLEDTSTDQWTLGQMVDYPLKGVKIIGDDIYKTEYRSSNSGEKLPENSASIEVGTMIDQIAGFPRFSHIKQNIVKSDSDQYVPPFLTSPNNETNDLPKLLIYFPPPLNFFIYYSVKNQSQATNNNPKSKSSNSNIKRNRMISPWKKSSHSMSKFEKSPKGKTYLEATKVKKQSKQKEFEYIRKMIRELIEYWDDEEKYLDNSKEEDSENNKEDNDSFYKEENNNQNMNYPKESVDSESTKPTFNRFLEWLTKNSNKDASFLEGKSRKKIPLRYTQTEKYRVGQVDRSRSTNYNPVNSSSYSENTDDINPKKIRILVDIDKNPNIMESFFERHSNAHSNKSDTHDYQIIVNLQDFFDPIEESIISRKLVDIAANQLHKNLTNNLKLPKTLWVFPIYDDEENDTLIAALENNKQRVNILENESLSSVYKDDNSEHSMHSYNKNNNYEAIKRRKEASLMNHDIASNEQDKTDEFSSENANKETDDNNKQSFDVTQNKKINEKAKVQQR